MVYTYNKGFTFNQLIKVNLEHLGGGWWFLNVIVQDHYPIYMKSFLWILGVIRRFSLRYLIIKYFLNVLFFFFERVINCLKFDRLDKIDQRIINQIVKSFIH